MYQNLDIYSKSTIKEVSSICLLHCRVCIKIPRFKTWQGQSLKTSLFLGMCMHVSGDKGGLHETWVFPINTNKATKLILQKSPTVFPSWPQLPQKS